MSRRGRRLAGASVVLGLAVAALGLWAFRRELEEAWVLLRLRSADVAVRQAALERLSLIGGDRSVPELARILREESAATRGTRASFVLVHIFPRTGRHRRIEAAAALREAALRGDPPSGLALRLVGPLCPDIFPVLGEDLRSSNPAATELAALVLIHAWPRSRREIVEYATRAEPKELLALLGTVRSRPGLGSLVAMGGGYEIEKVLESHPMMEWAALAEPAAFLARNHERPEVRAAGLVLAVIRETNPLDLDLDLLREVYTRDPHELPRRTALRIAGWLGRHPGMLDLEEAVYRESDPRIRAEAIQARELWASDTYPSSGFELWDGAAVEGLGNGVTRPPAAPWSDAEVQCLETILRAEKDARLREAASMALAGRYRALFERAWEMPQAPGLTVHEWGVWRDGGGHLEAAKALEELPGFVHRSFTTAKEIARTRVEANFQVLGVVNKPVIFFYASTPLSVLLEVHFRGGRPWTFYPEITDYTQAIRYDDGSEGEPAGLREPPWNTAEKLVPTLPRGKHQDRGPVELERRYWRVPWLVPRHAVVASSGLFPPRISGMGVEWCGLRVGYPAELEPELEDPGASPWWGFLREVPSALVAARDDAEGFVFYDGAIGSPGPILAAWEDPSRSALLLRARSLTGEPPPARGLGPAAPSRNRKGPLPAVFIIERADGRVRGKLLVGIAPADHARRVALADLDLEGPSLVATFDGALRGDGLTAEESRSLVRTWTKEFFETDGVRVVTVLPQWIYDSILPLRIAPVPRDIVRVGLVWKECDDLETGREDLEGQEGPWVSSYRRRMSISVEIERIPLASIPWESLAGTSRDGPLLRLGPGNPSAISADGKALLVCVPIPFGEKGQCSYRVVDIDSSRAFDVGFLESAGMPRGIIPSSLSADGKRLAFRTKTDSGTLLGVLDTEEGTVTTVRGLLDRSCRLSLDASGDRVGYSARSAVGVVDLSLGTGEEVEVGVHDESSVKLSADGRTAVFEAGDRENEVYLADLATGEVLNVSRSPGEDRGSSVSADGRLVLFSTRREGDEEVYLADLDTRSLRNLSNLDGDDSWPALASGGMNAVFASDYRIQVADLRTGRLTAIPGADRSWGPLPSSDGRRIAFARHDSDAEAAVIYVAELEP